MLKKALTTLLLTFIGLNIGARDLNLTVDVQKLGLTPANTARTSASTLYSRYEESSIATEFVRQLRAGNKLVEIPEVEAYIRQLGNKLSRHSGRSPKRFKFFVINDSKINAFAAAGGAIGIYKGLILKAKSESELAGVLAHEIAHVSQHHLERTSEAVSDPGRMLTQALLVAIAVAAGSSQVSQATIATARGTNMQRLINYTRAHEKEADNIGINIMRAAGYNPQGMVDFMQRLLKMQRFSSSKIPSYLLTHPLTADRVANAEQRAGKSAKGKKNSAAFLAIKAILRQNPTAKDTKGLKLSASNIYTRLLNARRTETKGNLGLAKKQYKAAYRQRPTNTAAIRRYANILIRFKDLTTAQKVLDQALKSHANNPQINKLMAKLKAAQGETAESYFWQANHDFLSGRTKLAIRQLNTARSLARNDFYLSSRIDARTKELKRIAKLEKRK